VRTGALNKNKRLIGAVAVALIAATALTIYRGQARSFEAEAVRLAELLAVEPGTIVGEIGAGDGEMALRMARRVGPSGHVFINELDPALLGDIRDAVADAGLQNVTLIQGSEDDVNLPEACCDAIYMRRVYHHITHPQELNASLHRALRPGGRLAVIDFTPDEAVFFLRWFAGRPEGVPQDRRGHGVPIRIVSTEMAEAGFRQQRIIEDWAGGPLSPHFCVLFQR
jgi:SAM-dependent methyltransferase